MRLEERLYQQSVEIRLDEVKTKNYSTGRLATPVHINGVLFDGTQDITITGGSSGNGSIGGYPVVITHADDGDTIIFNASSSTWNDVNKNDLMDGGNF